MNAEDFLTSLYESSWRKNMRHEATLKVDNLIRYLQDHRDEIAEDMVSSVQDMEALKLEQKEEFTYTSFKKWLQHYSKEVVAKALEDMQ